MKNLRQKLAILVAGLLPAALLLPLLTSASGNPVKPTGREDPPKISSDTNGFAGSASCAGRGCHGAVEPNTDPKKLRQDEFATWVRLDPHTNAFAVLKSDRADRMAENLIPLNGGKKINAYEDPKCLVCHSTPEFAAGATPEMRQLQSQGIGCETCHGAAKQGDGWLVAHTTKTWEKLSPADKAKAGMKVLSTPQGLAQACVGCHVGSARQDLNHDLMAAGHPRLVFEASTYHANLPAHWRENKYKDDPAYEAKLWAAGRVESARASLDLLKVRAEDTKKPWPEFAETGCFSCHSSLHPLSTDWRHRPGYRDLKVRGPGSLPYNEWFSTGLPELAKAVGVAEEPLQTDYKKMGQLMSQPYPDRTEVAKQVDATLKQLTTLGDKVGSLDPMKVRQALAAVKEEKLAALSWDESTQLVYALSALYAASPGEKDKKVMDQFAILYKSLAYPKGYESPANFRSEDVKKDTDKLTVELKELVKMLGSP